METGTLITSQIECFATLYNNPFLFTPLLPAFYKELGQKDRGVLLAYAVLPLVLSPVSRQLLSNTISTSSLRTFIQKRECLFGLGKRISDYRRMTNMVIQHNIDMKILSVTKEATIQVNDISIQQGLCPPEMIKAASRFGRLCRPHSVPVIFLQLGIKNL